MKRLILIYFFCLSCVSVQTDSYSKAKAVFFQAQAHIVYVIDQSTPWQDYADEVLADEVVETNCVGFAYTCAELLVREGVLPETVWIAKVRTETGNLHMVCVYDGWLLDNRQKYIFKASDFKYKWLERKNKKDNQWEAIQ